MKPRPVQDVEVTVSFRRHPAGSTCAFVTTSFVRTDGARSIEFSRHLLGSPERLVDQAVALVRDQIIEGWLVRQEPF